MRHICSSAGLCRIGEPSRETGERHGTGCSVIRAQLAFETNSERAARVRVALGLDGMGLVVGCGWVSVGVS